MKAFSLNETRNVFEIGAMIRGMVDDYEIEVIDGQDAFYYALGLAMQFEQEHPNSENYYEDLCRFTYDKLLEKFGFDD